MQVIEAHVKPSPLLGRPKFFSLSHIVNFPLASKKSISSEFDVLSWSNYKSRCHQSILPQIYQANRGRLNCSVYRM